jgi:hypothetical protein
VFKIRSQERIHFQALHPGVKTMRKIIFPSLLTALIAGCHPTESSQTKERWNAQNDPIKLMMDRDNYETNLLALPLKGFPTKFPWTDGYYPTYRGGIAHRWNWTEAQSLAFKEHNSGDGALGQLSDDPALQELRSKVYGYEPPSREDILAKTPEQLADLMKVLSPAEKYDIYRGAFDFPTVKAEQQRTNILATLRDRREYIKGTKLEGWWGLCHAWAPATIAFEEPNPISLVGDSGIKVDFASSDVKALLTYVIDDRANYNLNSRNESISPFGRDTILGARCNNNISGGNITQIFQNHIESLIVGNDALIDDSLSAMRRETSLTAKSKVTIASYIVAFTTNKDSARLKFNSFFDSYSNSLNNPKALRLQLEANFAEAGSPNATNKSKLLQAVRKAIVTTECNDTNAGAFHLVLANKVGLRHESFVVDITRGDEVWNQAVAGYESRVKKEFVGSQVSPEAAPGTVKEVLVDTTFYYTEERAEQWDAHSDGKTLERYHRKAQYNYVYRLELDAKNNIIGGSWEGDRFPTRVDLQDRPDFLWEQSNFIFPDTHAAVEQIYNASISQ